MTSFADATNKLEESFFNINAGFGRSFKERDFVERGIAKSLLARNLAMVFQIALVADQQPRKALIASDLDDFLPIGLQLAERLLTDD